MALRTAPRKRIGELLVDEGLVDSSQIDTALKVQQETGEKIVQILIDKGFLGVSDFAKFIASQPGVPSVELANYGSLAEYCNLIPRDYAVGHEVFPIDKMGKLLTVGMAVPLDTKTIAELGDLTGLRIKAMLCSADDIRNAIEKHYPKDDGVETQAVESADQIESAMKLVNVRAMVAKLDELPTLPETIHKVEEAISDPDVSMQDVANIVAMDPPIAAKVLQLANTPAFGFRQRVDSVSLAASLLGLKELYSVVLSTGVLDLMEKSLNFDYERFWSDSVFCAATCRAIAVAMGIPKMPGVSTAGLLHDIGRFALSEIAGERYAKIDKTLVGDDLIVREETEFGIGHPEAGYMLVTHWALPEDIAEPIRFHHKPDLAQNAHKLVYVVALGASITEARSQRLDMADHIEQKCSHLVQGVGLSVQSVIALAAEATERSA